MSQLSHALAMWCDRLYGAPVTWPALSTAPCVIHKLLVGAPPAAAILIRPGHSCSRAPWRAPSGGWGDVAQENGNKLFAVNNAFMVTIRQLLFFWVALSKMFIRIHQTDWYVQNDSFASDKWSVQTTIPKVLLKYNVFFPVMIPEDLAGSAGTLGSEWGASLWTISHTAGLQHLGPCSHTDTRAWNEGPHEGSKLRRRPLTTTTHSSFHFCTLDLNL